MDSNRPGSQEDFVSNWEPARSLVEDAVSGAEFAPRLPALAVTLLPLAGDGLQLASSPLILAQSFVLLVGPAVPYVRAFHGKVLPLSLSFFFLSPWLCHSLGCYLTLASSDCPQSIQAWSLP